MCRRFTKPSKEATSPASTNSPRANARIGIFADRKKGSKRQPQILWRKRLKIAPPTRCREMTSRELLKVSAWPVP